MPMTSHSGCASASSTAQSPVPVPMSSACLSSLTGEKYKRLPKVSRNKWCWRSSLSASLLVESACYQHVLARTTYLVIWEDVFSILVRWCKSVDLLAPDSKAGCTSLPWYVRPCSRL